MQWLPLAESVASITLIVPNQRIDLIAETVVVVILHRTAVPQLVSVPERADAGAILHAEDVTPDWSHLPSQLETQPLRAFQAATPSRAILSALKYNLLQPLGTYGDQGGSSRPPVILSTASTP